MDRKSIGLMLLILAGPVQAGHSVHELVERNDLQRVQEFIQQGHGINRANRYDETPLHLARTPEMIKLLIEGGAEVNIENHFGDSPLLQAVYRGDHGLVELLIRHGANLNHKNRFGDSPLQEAVNRDLIVMATLLVEQGADINAQGKQGDTVLHTAVRRGTGRWCRCCCRPGRRRIWRMTMATGRRSWPLGAR
jgi:ankyrin repeat protein